MSIAAHAIKHAVQRAGVDLGLVEDCYLGNVAHAGPNIGRLAGMFAVLPVKTAGMTMNRFCSSGLQSIAIGHPFGMTGTSGRSSAAERSTSPQGEVGCRDHVHRRGPGRRRALRDLLVIQPTSDRASRRRSSAPIGGNEAFAWRI